MILKKSITSNYLTAFILIVVLPILIISFLLNRFNLNTLQKNASDRILETMQQIAIGLNDEGKRVSLLTATIANDEEIIELATKWRQSSDPARKFNIARQIDSKLNDLFNRGCKK